MIYQPSKLIEAAMKAQNLNCDVMEGPDSSAVITGFDLKSGDAATLHFISMSDKNDVAVRIFHFAKGGDPHQVLHVVNELNSTFRYAKFVLRDGEVCVEMDIPQETTDIGKVAMEMLARSLDIMAQAAPQLKAAGATLEAAQSPSPADRTPAAPAAESTAAAEAPKKKFHLFGGNGK